MEGEGCFVRGAPTVIDYGIGAGVHHGHALVTLYVQFLCSDWSKFDR